MNERTLKVIAFGLVLCAAYAFTTLLITIQYHTASGHQTFLRVLEGGIQLIFFVAITWNIGHFWNRFLTGTAGNLCLALVFVAIRKSDKPLDNLAVALVLLFLLGVTLYHLWKLVRPHMVEADVHQPE